ncbi:MAG TPA: tyrosine--tRNA ligase [Tepidisphaeraceae bacterium]|nr:tyrosine--tRNA ligase [Tepidisphaeraceae bacterium]
MTIDEQIQALARRTERIVPEADLRKKLEASAKSGKPLRIKLGMDPTAPDVHLGHAVPLKIVRQFQDWGHKAVLIIGDSTARVGDPSGRNKTRPELSGEEIDANAKTYIAQVGKILLTGEENLEFRYNGEWFNKMAFGDVLKLLARRTVAQMLTREDFAKRYAEGTDIRLHELVYPLMQGWDSVMIDADVEMGGSDQLFNNLVGRDLQEAQGKPGQTVIVTPLLVGLDGVKKMSKSLGNYIGVTDPPSGQNGIFGKTMSLPDGVMETYYRLLTELPMDEVRAQIAASPRDAKVALAKHVITWLHSAEAAQAAHDEFNRLFGANKDANAVPDDTPTISVADMSPGPHKLVALLVKSGLAASNGEATRKIKENAVSVDFAKVTDIAATLTVDKPTVLKLGRKFARVVP